MNTVISDSNNKQELLKEFSHFNDTYLQSLVGSTQKDLFTNFRILKNVVKNQLNVSLYWAPYLYQKFSKEYADVKPMAEKLISELSHLAEDRKIDESFVEQFSLPEVDVKNYTKAIKDLYDLLEEHMIPVFFRLKELGEILLQIEQLIASENNKNTHQKLLSVFFENNDKEKELASLFFKKHLDIAAAIKAYVLIKTYIKDFQEKIKKDNLSPIN